MERSRRNHAAAALAILAAAAWIRLPALRTEPWLDEIWSIMFARAAKSVGDVLFGLHHDNNHPLNTLWLYWTSGRRDWALWRLPSFVSGLLIVGILAWDETDPAAGLLAAALAAGSAVMALYSTEARGYAMMTLCAVACRRLLASRDPLRPATAAAFAAAAALGF
ncbi:MAG: hypothetical protein KGL74_05885, partial [Elusimicrobia bacterium]|nr:hypothetical protein [Elusimicrobiota bacterium]